MLDYVKEYFHTHTHQTSGKSYPFRNKLDHTIRVIHWVERICAGENVDPTIPVTAAIFHDIGYNIDPANHPYHSSVLCREYLQAHDYPQDLIDKVCHVVAYHGRKYLLTKDSPIELVILIEADNIDEKGALCVLRDALSEGNRPLEEQSYLATFERIVRYAKKDTNNIMITKTGNAIWNEHIRILHEFLSSLAYDLGVEFSP